MLSPKLKQEEKQNLLGFYIGNLYVWCGQIPGEKKKIRDEGLICLTYIMVGKAEHQVDMCPQSGGKDRLTLELTWLPPFIQSEMPVHRIVPSTFRLSYFSSVNPLRKQPHMYTQGCVFWVILNSAKLPAAHLTFLLE